ncbi:GCN5-related N-acetyltransferase [Streptomyces violaceusniger Tu 4113]|uniref:GCN5-related N-acetyltransferase n=1 Tax=Streptomyces violaceusniger (strain Tu 4113) TaxID=653045 RepID=G2PDH9_STRV4|nr:GCN5-related N-acetyltransferase [Streptomyces violaceusniger Tu 4113]
MVDLRVVTRDDWPLWRDVRRAAPAEAPHAFTSRLADWPRGGEERWRARLETPGAHHVVALLDGRAVGMAGGLPGDGGPPELRSVWVSPEARGHGVGDRLIAAVGTWALRAGATALRLAVSRYSRATPRRSPSTSGTVSSPRRSRGISSPTA